MIKHPDPMATLSSITIDDAAFIVDPEIPTLFPITMEEPSIAILKTQGWIRPIELESTILLQEKLTPIVNFPPI